MGPIMLVGYMRVSKSDGSQNTDLQRDALLSAGVAPEQLYEDQASGKKDDRPQLAACLKAVRAGDRVLVWKIDRLGRNLRHLVDTVRDLTGRGVGLKVLTGQGAAIDTTTSSGKLVFGIFAALAERELISERTIAGLASARARLKRRLALQDDVGSWRLGSGDRSWKANSAPIAPAGQAPSRHAHRRAV